MALHIKRSKLNAIIERVSATPEVAETPPLVYEIEED